MDPDLHADDTSCLIALKDAGEDSGAVVMLLRTKYDLSIQQAQRALRDPNYFFASIHVREVGWVESELFNAGATLIIKHDPDR